MKNAEAVKQVVIDAGLEYARSVIESGKPAMPYWLTQTDLGNDEDLWELPWTIYGGYTEWVEIPAALAARLVDEFGYEVLS